MQRLVVTSARFHRGRPIVGLEGIDSMTDADELAGVELRIPTDRLYALASGTFYRHDLVGCAVETVEGVSVGIVAGVEGTLGGSRLVVSGRQGEVLIPLVSAICTAVEPSRKRIVIDPPAGLLEVNR